MAWNHCRCRRGRREANPAVEGSHHAAGPARQYGLIARSTGSRRLDPPMTLAFADLSRIAWPRSCARVHQGVQPGRAAAVDPTDLPVAGNPVARRGVPVSRSRRSARARVALVVGRWRGGHRRVDGGHPAFLVGRQVRRARQPGRTRRDRLPAHAVRWRRSHERGVARPPSRAR